MDIDIAWQTPSDCIYQDILYLQAEQGYGDIGAGTLCPLLFLRPHYIGLY